MEEIAWDHALSLLALYVSHVIFSLSSQRSKEAKKKEKKNNAWSQVMEETDQVRPGGLGCLRLTLLIVKSFFFFFK